MCGRYQFTLEDDQGILNIAHQIKSQDPSWKPGEIYPQTRAPVLILRGEEPTPELQTWGFPGVKGRGVVINARCETALEKPMFRENLLLNRCVIPTTGFFEWTSSKEKTLFRLPGTPVVYLAGFYGRFYGMSRYCILTTQANQSVENIHSRMPVVLLRETVLGWLQTPPNREMLQKIAPPPLEHTVLSGQTTLW